MAVLQVFIAVVTAVSFSGLCGCRESAAATPPVATGRETPQGAPYDVLKGRWQRPDGGYVLEIRDVADSGAIDGAYFNPRPIRVARAQAAREGGSLKLMVELRDANYPGSTYTLTYDPADDRLKGSYYQAVAKQTYRVVFLRVTP